MYLPGWTRGSVRSRVALIATAKKAPRGWLWGLSLALLTRLNPVMAVATEEPGIAHPQAQPGSLLWAESPDSSLAITLAEIGGAPLRLAAAEQLALQNATQARQAEADLAAALGALRRERGAFDPELFGAASIGGTDTPAASPFTGAEVLTTRQRSASGGARVRLRTGTELTASVEAIRLESNSDFAALLPQYDAAARLELRQPLLAGFGPAANGQLRAVERQFEAARARYEDALLGLRAGVAEAYWGLYADARDYAVQILVRDRAKALLTEVQLRARAGLVGPNEVANARVFLAQQEQAVFDAQERLDASSDRLGSLLGQRPGVGNARFRPVDDPPVEFELVAVDSLVAWSQRRNQELRSLERQLAAARARLKAADWNARPDLDLVGSLGGSGLAGDPRQVIFGEQTFTTPLSGGIDDALGQAVSGDYRNWQVGLLFTLPLGGRARGGERDRLRAEVQGAEQQLLAASRSLEEQVWRAHRELANGSPRLEVAREGVDAATEQVRIGQIEYHSGRTTAFELVRLGADLATAQQRYSQALVRSAIAAARLRQLTGNIYPSEATP